MHILITGGAGYIGFSLLRELSARSDIEKITVIDNLARRNFALFVSGSHGRVPVDFRRMEILDGRSLQTVVNEANVIFHLAGHAITPQLDVQHHVYDQVNNWGTSELARCIEQASQVRQVVYLSSFAVYGSNEEPVTEETEPAPFSSYGMSKLAGEAHVRRLQNDNRCVQILRAGNVYGFNPAVRFDAVVNAMAFDACTAGLVSIHGNGHQVRPLIDVSSLATLLSALINQLPESGTWNVANENVSVNEIADTLAKHIPNLDRIDIPSVRQSTTIMHDPNALARRLGIRFANFTDAALDLVTALQSGFIHNKTG